MLEEVVVSKEGVGMGDAVVGSSQLRCCPRRGKGGCEAVVWCGSEKERVAEMSDSTEMVDGEGEKEEVVGVD